MPERILQSDGHHDMSSSNRSERGFASASEPSQQSAVSAAEPAQQAFVPPGRVQNAPAPPWTPTRELRKRNFLPRRMGHLMEVLHAACPYLAYRAHHHHEHCVASVTSTVSAPSGQIEWGGVQVLDREAQAKAADEKKFPDFETGDLLELTLVCHLCSSAQGSAAYLALGLPSAYAAPTAVCLCTSILCLVPPMLTSRQVLHEHLLYSTA